MSNQNTNGIFHLTPFENEENRSNSMQTEQIKLREKVSDRLFDIKTTRNRLSDSFLIQQNHLSTVLNGNSANIFRLQTIQHHPSLSKNLNNLTLNQRTFRLLNSSNTLETIHQRSTKDFNNELQKLFIVRHSERVDTTFGSNWIDHVFDKSTGIYRRINLNLPKKMVSRKDFKDFLFDPPITELGLYQCRIVGEELASQNIQIKHVYSSPALRCVQTADQILEGLQTRDQITIRIEPCLFEFLKWYPVVPVKWPFLDLDELSQNGFNIDKTYKPFYPIESLRKDEDEFMYYARSHLITKSILKNHESDDGNILLVGHAPTIEVCTRQLIGGQPRVHELKYLVQRVPFLSMHTLAKQVDGTWKAMKPPVSPNKQTAVEPFDWRFFR